MRRVLLNFDHRELWSVHFIEADCRTLIGPKTRYYHFATDDGLRAFIVRCNVEDLENFEHSLRAWGRGSNYVRLTDEQYAKLKHIPKTSIRRKEGWHMTAENQAVKETYHADNKGEVRPSTEKSEKLEDKIADEKDDELADKIASDELTRDSRGRRH